MRRAAAWVVVALVVGLQPACNLIVSFGDIKVQADGGAPSDGGAPRDGGNDAPPMHPGSFLSETAGGATITSAGYRLDLFVAPSRPVGAGQSANYKLQLGPGAARNAR